MSSATKTAMLSRSFVLLFLSNTDIFLPKTAKASKKKENHRMDSARTSPRWVFSQGFSQPPPPHCQNRHLRKLQNIQIHYTKPLLWPKFQTNFLYPQVDIQIYTNKIQILRPRLHKIAKKFKKIKIKIDLLCLGGMTKRN
jgi:hypothetical protein